MHYVLNVSNDICLSNGLRYLKELLLQDHNHRIYGAYTTLLKNGVDVYSAKTEHMNT